MYQWLLTRDLEFVVKGVESNLGEDGCAVVGDSDIAVGGDQNLVQATGTLRQSIQSVPSIDSGRPYQRTLDNVGHCFGGNDVRFDSFSAMLSLLLSLAMSNEFALSVPTVPSRVQLWYQSGRKDISVNVLANYNKRTTLLILHHRS